jgi:acyl-CoA synthetase (AMP-forming)/AMP-acid ligase II
MGQPWKRHWPPGLDEGALRLPGEPISAILKANALAAPRQPAIIFYGRFANCELQRAYVGMEEADVHLAVLPWFHITGMECQMNVMAYTGAPVVALARFDPEALLQAIQRYRCTITTLITTINVALVNDPRTKQHDLRSLRACFSGGAPVPEEIARRKKDLIKASGYSVFPAEVESLMYRHPAVAEVGVVGVPDDYRGEDVVAFVVRKAEAEGVTEQQIVDWCRESMSVYKAPRRVCFTDSLPRTASGKVLKRVLRARASEPARPS